MWFVTSENKNKSRLWPPGASGASSFVGVSFVFGQEAEVVRNSTQQHLTDEDKHTHTHFIKSDKANDNESVLILNSRGRWGYVLTHKMTNIFDK